MKEVLEKEIKPKEIDKNSKKDNDEIIIEDNSTKKGNKSDSNTNKDPIYNNNSYTFNTSNVNSAMFNNIDPSKVNQAREQIKNMVKNNFKFIF